MSVPSVAELQQILLNRIVNGNEPPTALALAQWLHTALVDRAFAETGQPCAKSGCPNPRVLGLEDCPEHTAERIRILRRELAELVAQELAHA